MTALLAFRCPPAIGPTVGNRAAVRLGEWLALAAVVVAKVLAFDQAVR